MSRSEVVACYRLYAAYCLDLAQHHVEPDRRIAWLAFARAWSRLADQAEKNDGSEFPICRGITVPGSLSGPLGGSD
jgi:hypothetical protein